jgi:putative transposase
MRSRRTGLYRLPQGASAAESQHQSAERLNAEIKRRTDVVGISPNEPSITRLVGALLLEQNDEWQLQRRYVQLEGLQTLGDNQPARLSAVMN